MRAAGCEAMAESQQGASASETSWGVAGWRGEGWECGQLLTVY